MHSTRFISIALAIACAAFLPSANARATEVKVRLAQARRSITVTGIDIVVTAESGQLRSLGASLGASVARRAAGSRMSSLVLAANKVAGRFLWTVTDKAGGAVLGRLLGESVEVRGEMMRFDLKPAPGPLTLTPSAVAGSSHLMDVIARMDLETYLLGVLPKEMPAEWPIEALKAQAVASRSFALERVRLRAKEGKPFHLESTVLDQVFAWHEPEQIGGARLENVRKALNETRDEVLTDARGEVVAAYFHADCGGKTEAAAAVWGGEPKSTGIAVDGGCPLSPIARWAWSVTSEELAARLRSALGLSLSARVTDIRNEAFSASGRVLKLAVVTDDGMIRRLSGHQIRSVLGFDRLKSTAFEVRKAGDGSFRFNGQGHGHGVGLCQWGTRRLASRGADYKRILRHYYPKAVFSRLRSGESPI